MQLKESRTGQLAFQMKECLFHLICVEIHLEADRISHRGSRIHCADAADDFHMREFLAGRMDLSTESYRLMRLKAVGDF